MSDSVSEVDLHITKKYEIKKRLGKGAYGIVWKAINRKTGEVVAVKKIFDAFRNQTDAQRTFREIMFLQEFGNHPNVIKLLDVLRADNDRDIYLVFEFMETDLHNVIKRGNILKDIHKRYIMYQLFKATKYLHSGNVVHRDQKPSNILLDADCFAKVADFGLARSLTQLDRDDQGDPALTEYVATRWYRAPEILLSSKRYTKGVDTWSLGCILGEMVLGKPLFPGTSTLNQIERIMCSIPSPNKSDIESIGSGYALSLLEKVSSRPRLSLMELIPNVTEDALDLLGKLLVFNPDKRLTAEQALNHPYVSRFHNAAEEPSLDYDVLPPFSDNVQLSIDQYRNKLYEMIQERRLKEKKRMFDRHNLILREKSLSRPFSAKESNKAMGDNSRVLSQEHRSSSGARCSSHPRAVSADSKNASRLRHHYETYPMVHEKINAASDGCYLTSPVEEESPVRPHRNLSAPPAGLPSGYAKCNAAVVASRATAALRDHRNTKTVVPPKTSTSTGAREKAKPQYGKKQFGNYTNMTTSGVARSSLYSYSQSHGTITESGLQDLRHLK